jgi:hypothetical protein
MRKTVSDAGAAGWPADIRAPILQSNDKSSPRLRRISQMTFEHGSTLNHPSQARLSDHPLGHKPIFKISAELGLILQILRCRAAVSSAQNLRSDNGRSHCTVGDRAVLENPCSIGLRRRRLDFSFNPRMFRRTSAGQPAVFASGRIVIFE